MSDEAKRIVAEETWGISRRIADGSYEVSCETDNIPVAIGYTEEEARIAACAPEALRILNRWEAYAVDGVCPECEEVKHDDDCALMAVLRKAGVRE